MAYIYMYMCVHMYMCVYIGGAAAAVDPGGTGGASAQGFGGKLPGAAAVQRGDAVGRVPAAAAVFCGEGGRDYPRGLRA